MRIAMFTNNYKPFVGGVPISIERLCGGLRELGHEVVVFAPDYGVGEEEEHVVRYKTLYRKNNDGMMIGNCFDSKIEKRFSEGNFDVIHVHHPMISGYAALYLGKKYGIPVAYTYHTRYEEYLHYFKIYNGMERHGLGGAASYIKKTLVPRYTALFANACDLVFAPTQMMKDCLGGYGVRTETAVLPTGLEDASFVERREAAEEIRARIKGEKTYLFCTAARLEKEKNLDFLLRGTAEVKRRIGDCFRLMVIGEGSERERLMELAVELGLQDNLVFTGKVPNEQIRDYLSAGDVFLFASRSETQGIVLLEAMAAGMPVVAVRASGVVDIVKDGFNGYMTEEDEGEWAEAVRKIAGHPQRFHEWKEHSVWTASAYRSSRVALMAAQGYRRMLEGYREGRSAGVWRRSVRDLIPRGIHMVMVLIDEF